MMGVVLEKQGIDRYMPAQASDRNLSINSEGAPKLQQEKHTAKDIRVPFSITDCLLSLFILLLYMSFLMKSIEYV